MSESSSSGMPPVHRYIHRVAFSETDAAGIAHFSNFFRWMEEAEASFFRQLQFPLFDAENMKGFPRVEARCSFKQPFSFDEDVEVLLHVEELRSSAIRYNFDFKKPATGELAAEGGMTTIFARRTETGALAAVPLPDELREAITQSISKAQA